MWGFVLKNDDARERESESESGKERVPSLLGSFWIIMPLHQLEYWIVISYRDCLHFFFRRARELAQVENASIRNISWLSFIILQIKQNEFQTTNHNGQIHFESTFALLGEKIKRSRRLAIMCFKGTNNYNGCIFNYRSILAKNRNYFEQFFACLAWILYTIFVCVFHVFLTLFRTNWQLSFNWHRFWTLTVCFSLSLFRFIFIWFTHAVAMLLYYYMLSNFRHFYIFDD